MKTDHSINDLRLAGVIKRVEQRQAQQPVTDILGHGAQTGLPPHSWAERGLSI
ncbi:MAG: hypothetical protein ABSE90_01080 [Verrucomicrobiota bacterium]